MAKTARPAAGLLATVTRWTRGLRLLLVSLVLSIILVSARVLEPTANEILRWISEDWSISVLNHPVLKQVRAVIALWPGPLFALAAVGLAVEFLTRRRNT